VLIEAQFHSNTYPTDRGTHAVRLAGEFGFVLREQMNLPDRGSVMTRMVFEASDPDPMCVEWFTNGLASYEIRTEIR
jgi:hypothetical protein